MRIFLGYDSKEAIAYHVLADSIIRRASRPVSITPLALNQLSHIYTRKRGPMESTEFSFTRFLVPYLSDYQGLSLYMDCDMLCKCDLTLLEPPPGPAVWIVPHDYTPKATIKFRGHGQTTYPRKNWSSLMLFDNERCRVLTPDYVNQAPGLDLHRFYWLDDNALGYLPLEMNWLVGEYAPNPQARILHYTLGTPCFPEYSNCDHASDWWAAYDTMRRTE